MALVSVIIPYYRKKNHIKKTLKSVLDQTFQDFEIILVYDDPNSDDLILSSNVEFNSTNIPLIIDTKFSLVLLL